MFRTLRINFVATTMVFVIIVMTISFSTVCLFKYQNDFNEVGVALSAAANMPSGQGNNDSFRWQEKENERFDVNDIQSEVPDISSLPNRVNNDSAPSNEPNPIKLGKMRTDKPRGAFDLIPIATYAIDADGTATIISDSENTSISAEVSEEAIQAVFSKPDGQGELSELGLVYYKIHNNETNTTQVAFTDSSYISGWQNLALTLGGVGIATILVFFLAALFLSKRALKPVQDAWTSQRQFVADASHDLKTPLTVILANMSILLQHPNKTISDESQWIENTQREANTMQELVSEMLELAQVESYEDVEISYETIDFSDIVEEQTLLLDAMAIEKGCEFNCSAEENICVEGNATQLAKMVKTLLENAFKYVNDKGRVEVTLVSNQRSAKLSISNTGIPIAKEDIEHVFDRFYRSDKARTSGEGGFGLGLAIARGVAQSHGGNISCSSSKESTTFTVVLPLVKY